MVIYGFADYGMTLYVMTLKRMRNVLSPWKEKICEADFSVKKLASELNTVSYTHLDVYKRQAHT